MYNYPAKCLRVVDGDTIELEVDLGFYVKVRQKFRIYGIDSPELKSEEGRTAKRRLAEKVEAKDVILDTIKDKQEKYGRYLCVIRIDGTDIGSWMVAEGLAKPYYGGERK